MKLYHVAAAAAVIGLATVTAAYGAGNRIWSPHKVTRQFVAKHFKIDDVRRKGSTYLVVATGPKGNKVRFVVDGKTGTVRGMDVVHWAPGAHRVRRGSHGVAFYSEYYEFGVTVPQTEYVTWVDYDAPAWSVSEEYVEVTTEEYTEDVTYEEVTYEETVTEETVTEEAVEEETVDDEASDAPDSDDGDADDSGDGDNGGSDD